MARAGALAAQVKQQKLVAHAAAHMSVQQIDDTAIHPVFGDALSSLQ
jgi:hypothetical protein